jgi:CBS domain-containing protein
VREQTALEIETTTTKPKQEKTMLIKEVMSKDPEYASPSNTLQEVADRMRDLNVGMIPVGDGIKLKGAITDRDIVIRSTAEGQDPTQVRVSDVMTAEVLYAFEDQELDEAVKMMKKEQVRRLIILNRDKDMTGILAIGDIANRTHDEEEMADALEGVSSN